MEYSKVVRYRAKGSTIDTLNSRHGKPIGWLCIKDNVFGWSLHELDESDRQWFTDQSEQTTNTYRIVSDKGNTSLVRMSPKHGTAYFFDNEFYEKTDLIAFECKGYAVLKLFFDIL